MLYLHQVNCFVPEDFLTIEEAGHLYGLSPAEVRVYKRIYGIEKIPRANMPLKEMLMRSLKALLEQSAIDTNLIRYCIYCHTAKVVVPFGEPILQTLCDQAGLKNVIAFGTSTNNCASPLVSLDLLDHILDRNEWGIILCGDLAITSVLQVIPNTSLLGEASSAILVSQQVAKDQLLAISTQTMGRYAAGLWLTPEDAKHFEQSYPVLLAQTICDAIRKAHLSLDQIRIIIPHNINLPSWQRVAKELKISLNKIWLSNVKQYSHCFGADIFINFVSIEAEKLIQPGDYWIMATVGLGATFSAAVFIRN
ncbi:MAG: 3-oxoacyl-[acyl-carrier-protein] synthase III C-terminal domain-containing protein [Gammaproteobacteria bacterium]|nr:3-oxoacyl-[acyl-carrier-protein] synthase III C-terminal domain-containing protein [Gammaproteobacteria bacterium]